MTNEEKHRQRLQELEALDDKRLQVQQQIELYQARITRAFNKKVKMRTFKKGDLVLAVRRPMVMTHKTRQISAQVGRTICSRVSLLKWIISSHNLKWRYTHDADQWQVPEEILSLDGILPLIKLKVHL